MLGHLRLIVLSCALALTANAAPVDAPLEIPFQFNDGFIAIEGRVAPRSEPLFFLLDSGAGASLLSFRTARRLHLKLGAPVPIQGVGSDAVAHQLPPTEATAGGISLRNIALATDLHVADEICGRPVDGLIGIDFFKDRVVQIDYPRRCLRIFGTVPASDSAERLPIVFRNGIICVPVGVNGSQPRLTRFDTGCNDALHWVVPRRAAAPERRSLSVGFATDPRDLSLTTVALGTRSMPQVQTALHGHPLFPGEAGLLGNEILCRFVATVDWPGRQVLLEEASR